MPAEVRRTSPPSISSGRTRSRESPRTSPGGTWWQRCPTFDSDAAFRVNRFAFTEMVNNANEHSGGSSVEIGVSTTPNSWFRVVDDGVGVFRHFASRLGLPDEAAAAFELTKGKRTTAPDEHSGEGIFFTAVS